MKKLEEELEPKYCLYCDVLLVRRPDETITNFKSRSHCNKQHYLARENRVTPNTSRSNFNKGLFGKKTKEIVAYLKKGN